MASELRRAGSTPTAAQRAPPRRRNHTLPELSSSSGLTLRVALESQAAALEEEAQLDGALEATHREISDLRLSLAAVAHLAVKSHLWAEQARARAASHGMQPVGLPPTPRSDASPAAAASPCPQPQPEPEPEQEYGNFESIEAEERPDWALGSEQISAASLIKERLDVAKEVVEQGGVEAVYENERRSMLGGAEDFAAKNLVPGTRGHWSDKNGNRAELGRLPHGWHWAVEHRAGQTDPEGWEYAFHFRATWFAEAERPSAFGGTAWVRRRKWVPSVTSHVAAPSLKVASPASDAEAGFRAAPSYRCVVEVWEARSLSMVVDGEPDRLFLGNAIPPSAVFRIRVGSHWHQSGIRPPSSSPLWGDETNSARCRHTFRIATPADVLAEAEEDDDLGRLARHFAGLNGVKVRDRRSGFTTHKRSFTGQKAVNWLTGVHSRGYHGSGLVATREEAVRIAQQMMDRSIFEGQQLSRTAAFRDSSSAFYRFDADWLSAKSRESKIMLRRKTLEKRESMRQTRSGSAKLDENIAVGDELVVELLDADLAARLGATEDVLPEQLLGSTAIPLHTICKHAASEGWHNLQGPHVESGEVRIAWMLLEDFGDGGLLDNRSIPSPRHHLKVKGAAEAAEASAAAAAGRQLNVGDLSPSELPLYRQVRRVSRPLALFDSFRRTLPSFGPIATRARLFVRLNPFDVAAERDRQ